MKKYKNEGLIGSGATSVVYKISDESGNYYALKMMRKKKDSKANERMKNEIEIQSQLDNPHILKIIEHEENSEFFNIVTELCNENLYMYMKNKKIEEDEAISIFKQIVDAVKYLHDNGITHRDLKLENVVKCGKIWKIIDFGFSTKEPYLTEMFGTLDYLSPEVINAEMYSTKMREKALPTDIWALGILLYELLYKKPPFLEKTYKGTYKLILNKKPDFSEREISPKTEDLIKDMLNKDPKKRITIDELLNRL